MFWYSLLLSTQNLHWTTSWHCVDNNLGFGGMGRYSSLLVMTLGETAYSFCLALVSLPQKREHQLHGDKTRVHCWYVSFPCEVAKGLMNSIGWFSCYCSKISGRGNLRVEGFALALWCEGSVTLLSAARKQRDEGSAYFLLPIQSWIPGQGMELHSSSYFR